VNKKDRLNYMGLNIFENIISERLGNKAEARAEGVSVLDNAAEKTLLLSKLPQELQAKSLRENFPIEHLKKIVEFRESKGFETVTGFHVSPRDFKVGDKLRAGLDGEVYFSTRLDSLYAGKKPTYLYAVECSKKLMKTIDKDLDWHTLLGELTIIDKIKITPEAVEALGVKFSECTYS